MAAGPPFAGEEFALFSVFPTARIRPSPFYEACVAEGMTTASVYNRMILPASFGDPEAEYWRLIKGVSQWDVADCMSIAQQL